MAGGGGGYSDDGDGASISEINVTPLVDIVLVLLIVFMVTMPAIVAEDARNERELDLQLPQASQAAPLTKQPAEILVNVRSTGAYVVKGDVLTKEELAKQLSQAATDNPGRVAVLIRADRNTAWDRVVSVMDMCHALKIEDCRAAAAE